MNDDDYRRMMDDLFSEIMRGAGVGPTDAFAAFRAASMPTFDPFYDYTNHTRPGSDYWGASSRRPPRPPEPERTNGRRHPFDVLEKMEEYDDPALDRRTIKRTFRSKEGEVYTTLDHLTALEAASSPSIATSFRARRINSREELRRNAEKAAQVRADVRSQKPWGDGVHVTPKKFTTGFAVITDEDARVPVPTLDPVSQAAKAAARDQRPDVASSYVLKVGVVQDRVSVGYVMGIPYRVRLGAEVQEVNTYVYGGVQQLELEIQLRASLDAARQSSAAFPSMPYMVALVRHMPDNTARMIGAAVYRAGMTWDAARKRAGRQPVTPWEHAIFRLMEE